MMYVCKYVCMYVYMHMQVTLQECNYCNIFPVVAAPLSCTCSRTKSRSAERWRRLGRLCAQQPRGVVARRGHIGGSSVDSGKANSAVGL